MGYIGNQITTVFPTSISLDTVTASTSLKTPLVEFTDGDNAMSIADGGTVTFTQVPVNAGGGKILQVVSSSTTTGTGHVTSITSALTVSITPSATSSKVFVAAMGAGSVICGSSGIMEARIYRGGVSDTAIQDFYSGLGSATNGHEHYITPSLSVTDSPSTTSAQTYTFAVTKGSGGTTSARIMGGSTFPITMIAMEIGA
jgi:hypothetical protein